MFLGEICLIFVGRGGNFDFLRGFAFNRDILGNSEMAEI